MGRRESADITAGELMDQLANDPEFQARERAEEERRLAREREQNEIERPLVADLEEVGAPVTESVYDLVNTSEPYPQALPVLMRHLEAGGYPPVIMEGIGRALAVRDSIGYWDRLRACYENAQSEPEQDGVAIALSACATADHVDDLIELLTDDTQGEVRVFFVKTLGKLGGERGRRVIESLVDDPVVGKEATAFVTRARKRAAKKARKT